MADTNFTRERTYAPPLPHRLNGRRPAKKIDLKPLLVVAALVIIVALASYIAGIVMSPAAAAELNLPTESIEHLFIDVNNDGLLDFVVKMEVIPNPGVHLPLPTAP